MLVLTRGGGISYRVDPDGAYVRAIDDEVYEDGKYLKWLPHPQSGLLQRFERLTAGNIYYWDSGPQFEWVRVGPGVTDHDYVRVTYGLGGTFDRYTRVATGGGSVRWANMQYCR